MIIKKSNWDKNRELNEKLNLVPNVWPHQFIKDGPGEIVGQQDDFPIVVTPMVCRHCLKKYLAGRQSLPQEPCPARSDRREMRRILR